MSTKSDANPVTDEEKVSYGLGWQFGRHLLGHDFEGLDLEMAFKGTRDCYEDRQSPITDEEVEEAFKLISSRVEQARQEKAAEMAGKSEALLGENAQRPEVTVTSSGLQYEVVEAGEGDQPGPLDSVKVHYHGTFFNGEVFDSSMDRGIPAEFPLQNVIPGWTELLQLMTVGSKWRAFIPAELAYGEHGSPPRIPGNCALIFDIELLDIV
jgi:FKBP-type peptidyl-prolyl cis-trans isomerase FklB